MSIQGALITGNIVTTRDEVGDDGAKSVEEAAANVRLWDDQGEWETIRHSPELVILYQADTKTVCVIQEM